MYVSCMCGEVMAEGAVPSSSGHHPMPYHEVLHQAGQVLCLGQQYAKLSILASDW